MRTSTLSSKYFIPLITLIFFLLSYLSPFFGLAFAALISVIAVSVKYKDKVFYAFIFLYPMLPRYFAVEISARLPLITGARLLIFYTIMFDLIVNVKYFKNWKTNFKKFKLKIPLIIYISINILNFMQYPYAESLKNLISITIEYLFVLIYIFLRVQDKNEFIKVINIFSYSACFIGLLGIFEFLSDINIFSYLDIIESERVLTNSGTTVRLNESRIEGPFGHPLAYCNYLMLVIPISVYMLIKNIRTRNMAKYICICIILAVNLILTMSRGPILSLLIGFIAYFFFLHSELKKKIILLSIGVVTVVAMGYVTGFLPSVIRDFLMSVVDVVLMRNSVSGFGGNANPRIYRLFLFTIAKSLIIDGDATSLFWGKGYNYLSLHQVFFYIPALKNTMRIRSIDNNYLLRLIDAGILGLGAELIILFKITFLCIKKFYESTDKQVFAFFIFLTVSYFTCLFTEAELGTMRFYWLILGIVMWRISDDDMNKSATNNVIAEVKKYGRAIDNYSKL